MTSKSELKRRNIMRGRPMMEGIETMSRLDTLKQLQTRIREATGPSRELDLEICKAFGRAPQDAIWEVDENLPPELAKHYKQGWTTPAYVEQTKEFRRSFKELLASNPTDEQSDQWHDNHKRDWDWKNAPPCGSAPRYTSSLDACVALMREVLPGYAWKVGTCCVSDDAWVVPDFNCPIHGERLREKFGEIEHGGIWDTGIDIDRRPSGNVCLALLDAIISAKIAELEAEQEKEKADA